MIEFIVITDLDTFCTVRNECGYRVEVCYVLSWILKPNLHLIMSINSQCVGPYPRYIGI